jgi:hypothetical protein
MESKNLVLIETYLASNVLLENSAVFENIIIVMEEYEGDIYKFLISKGNRIAGENTIMTTRIKAVAIFKDLQLQYLHKVLNTCGE